MKPCSKHIALLMFAVFLLSSGCSTTVTRQKWGHAKITPEEARVILGKHPNVKVDSDGLVRSWPDAMVRREVGRVRVKQTTYEAVDYVTYRTEKANWIPQVAKFNDVTRITYCPVNKWGGTGVRLYNSQGKMLMWLAGQEEYASALLALCPNVK